MRPSDVVRPTPQSAKLVVTTRIRTAIALGFVALAACRPPAAKTVKAKGPPPEAVVGKACATDKPFTQGDCEEGYLCAPFPEGYCTSFAPCGEGEKRVETARIGEICARPCAEDDECRKGYVCHPGWKACVPPKLASPKLAKCDRPALTKKGFGPALALTKKDSPGSYQTEPVAALDAKGNVVVAYVAGASFGKSTKVATLHVSIDEKGDAKVDVGAKLVESDRQTQGSPWITRSPKGELALAFLDHNGAKPPETKMRVSVITSKDGVTWSAPVAGHDPADCEGDVAGCLDKPMLAFGRDPKAAKDTLFAFYFSEPDVALKVTRSVDFGKSFAGPSSAIGNGAYANVDIGSKGAIHIAYHDGEGDAFGDVKNSIRYLRSDDGGRTFLPAVRVSAEDEPVPFYFSSPQIAADDKRKAVYAAYPVGKPDGIWQIMLASSKDNGATWSRIKVNDDDACANHATPAMAVDPNTGRIHLTWIDHRTGTAMLAYTSCEPGGAKCDPSEAVGDAPFSSYGLIRRSPKWTGDYRSLVVDPTKKILHAVWAQTVNDDGKMVSRLFHARKKL